MKSIRLKLENNLLFIKILFVLFGFCFKASFSHGPKELAPTMLISSVSTFPISLLQSWYQVATLSYRPKSKPNVRSQLRNVFLLKYNEPSINFFLIIIIYSLLFSLVSTLQKENSFLKSSGF